MKQLMKNGLWAGILLALFSACAKLEPTPAIIESPAPTSAPVEGIAPEKFNSYIGLKYPPFPSGLTQDLSMLIQDSDGYGLWLVSDGGNKMLWLSRITHYDSANGNPFWEVQDVADLSNLETGLVLIPDGCFLNGQPDPQILVASKNGFNLLAWRANTALNVFEVISTNGIECHSDKGVRLD